jgi:glutathione S-transferase
MNPNGLVPVIEDGDFVLYESNPIVRYLAEREGATPLWPSDPKARADVDRWMEWQSTSFTPAMWGAFWQLVRTPADKRDLALVESSRVKTERLAGILDAHLASRRHLTGDGFTVADIVVGCAAHRWLNLPVERAPRKNLERWYAELKARPGAQKVVSQAIS